MNSEQLCTELKELGERAAAGGHNNAAAILLAMAATIHRGLATGRWEMHELAELVVFWNCDKQGIVRRDHIARN